MGMTFGWYVVLPLIGTIIAVVWALVAMEQNRSFAKTFVVVQLALIVIFNGLLAGGSRLATSLMTVAESYSDSTICDAAKDMGLESGHEYPVELGSNVDGSYGGGYFTSGLLGGETGFDIHAGRGVLVGFNPPGKVPSFLTLPTDKMNPLVGAPGSQTTITIHLSCRSVQAQQIVHNSESRLILDSGIFYFEQHEVSRDAPVITDESITKHGLAPIVTSYLDSVDVHLSPELYQKILG